MTETFEDFEQIYWAVNPSLGIICGKLQKDTSKLVWNRMILLPELSREKAGEVRYALNNRIFKTKEEAAAYGISYYKRELQEGLRFVQMQKNRVEFIQRQLSGG